MYCSNCGNPLPETARFCPECGAPVAKPVMNAESVAVDEPTAVEEPVAVEEPIVVDEPVAVEPVAVDEPTAVAEPTAAEEPVAVDEPIVTEEPVAEEPVPVEETAVCPCKKSAEESAEVLVDAPEPVPAPAKRGLHPVGVITVVLLALTALFLGFELMTMYLQLYPLIPILFAALAILTTVLTCGMAVASFIVGLAKKRTATWIVGLSAALLSVFNFVLAVIYLVASLMAAVF